LSDPIVDLNDLGAGPISKLVAIYIHIPFCVKKCDYCDFYSVTDLTLVAQYIKALTKEILSTSAIDGSVQSVYFGGGTPSVLEPLDIEKILSAIHQTFCLVDHPEITLEMNPGTIDPVKLSGYFSVGVNRLSIGVQSFNDEKLKFLTRIHTAADAIVAMKHAQLVGFKNIGLDLMFGLPFETREQWQNDLDQAVKMNPSHLSCYLLTLEPETPLEKRVKKEKLKILSNEKQSRLFEQTSLFLTRSGYEHYEISNFAKGRQNRSSHNASYWQGKSYLGFGAAAHSFSGIVRSWNHSNIKKYILDVKAGFSPVKDRETLTLNQQMIEVVMLGLRTSDGIDTVKFEKRFNQSFQSVFHKQIKNILANGLATFKQNRFSLNLDGRVRLNAIVGAFVENILDL